jgi:redox-sensitive bicupin YhaK (pirin superfamily)
MTVTIRRDAEISDVDGGWFRARWHFSFDTYDDPDYVQFGTLRVFNDDRLVPGAIWPLHPHRDIEGLTYVVEGSFRHEDDVGGPPGPLPAGSVQRMTLGRGAWHSEQNASETEPMRFIQMWILPAKRGLEPGVEQKVFTEQDRTDRLLKAISGDGGDAVLVHQDAHVFVSKLQEGKGVSHPLGAGRGVYLYVIEGDVDVVGERMSTGDAAEVRDEPEVTITANATSELIAVDVSLDLP